MSFEDFLTRFDSATVCKVRQWEEVRTRGCFLRCVSGEAGWMSGPMDSVISKWYYRLDVTRKEGQQVHIGLHQEDERIRQNGQRRPFLDVGMVVLRQAEDGSFELVDKVSFETDR